jgi:glycosyltransferase involved in cell wall biosynthesis
MHVLITSDVVGGVWTYTRELVTGLVRRGHRVSLVSFGRLPQEHQLAWMHGLPQLEYYATDFPLEWMQDSASGISASVVYLERLIHSIKPDLLHTNQYRYGALNCLIPRIVVAHSDVLSWWTEVHGNAPPETGWLLWYRDLVSAGLANADVVVAPSRWMADALGKHYPVPCKVSVIYNGRDPALFQPFASKRASALTVGRAWDEAKQVSLLLARSQCIPVHIVGPNEHPGQLDGSRKQITTPDSNVTLTGECSEEVLSALYAASSIYAITSRYEPFGLAPLEAALSRCALVANDIPTFRELWGDDALYFRRNDPDALAHAIQVLNENADARNDYAEKAWRRAVTRFDSKRMVSQYEALYSDGAYHGAAA